MGTVGTSGLAVLPPMLDRDNEQFWAACARGLLLLPRCIPCARLIWYPRSLCTNCGSRDLEWVECAGRGTIYSFTVTRRATGEFASCVPFVYAYVELEEGPVLATNIIDCDVEAVAIGQPVEAYFDGVEGSTVRVLRFRPL
jgi:uncharacterized protein